jgi:WD40 repeat protein
VENGDDAGNNALFPSASYHATARIWNVNTGDELRQTEHLGAVRAIAFSPDGRLILTGDNQTMRLWRIPQAVTKMFGAT